jgi:transposase
MLRAEVTFLREEVASLRAELGRITGGGNGPDASVPRDNPLRKQKERKSRKERKKRAQNFARKREKATREVAHVADNCPDCGRQLKGGWEHTRRQVIDIPAAPAEVIDYVIFARYCGVCNKRVLPLRDFQGVVVGKHRIGVRLMSLIAHFREVTRMPVRTVQETLKSLWGLSISTGEITALADDFARIGKPVYDMLREEVRQSDYCHSDETGWREDGVGGELWSVSTPTVSFFHRDTRHAHVIEEILGDYQGTVNCDFYAGYNHVGKRRQRCWTHYTRDLHPLKEACVDNLAVVSWVDDIIAVYRDAKDYQHKCRQAIASGGPAFGYTVFDRRRARKNYENALLAIARRLVPGAPDRQRVLAERIENFLPELFTFVEFPNVPSDNNAAERAIRPAVINRKVCGGTRSAKGSQTKTILMTLFHTWRKRAIPTIEEGVRMLAAHEGSPCARSPTG